MVITKKSISVSPNSDLSEKNMRNMQEKTPFGRFCVAVVYHYYRNNRNSPDLSEAVAIDRFKLAYKMAYNRDMFKVKHSLTVTKDVTLPGCLEALSLIFVINVMTWELMVRETQKAAGCFSKKK